MRRRGDSLVSQNFFTISSRLHVTVREMTSSVGIQLVTKNGVRATYNPTEHTVKRSWEAEAVAADAEAVAAAAVVAAETATVTGGDGEGTAHDCDVPIAPASPPPSPAPAHNRHTTAASDRGAGDDDGDGASPYLRLRRGAPALSLAGHKHINLPTRHGATQKADSLSIFGSRGSVAMGSVVARDGPCRYDGLGGQTRDWRPPSPGAAPRPAKLPRLTARHRLRPPPARPSCPPSHNISDMMQRIAAKDK